MACQTEVMFLSSSYI